MSLLLLRFHLKLTSSRKFLQLALILPEHLSVFYHFSLFEGRNHVYYCCCFLHVLQENYYIHNSLLIMESDTLGDRSIFIKPGSTLLFYMWGDYVKEKLKWHSVNIYWLSITYLGFILSFYVDVVSYLTEKLEDRTKNSSIHFTQISQMLTFYHICSTIPSIFSPELFRVSCRHISPLLLNSLQFLRTRKCSYVTLVQWSKSGN